MARLASQQQLAGPLVPRTRRRTLGARSRRRGGGRRPLLLPSLLLPLALCAAVAASASPPPRAAANAADAAAAAAEAATAGGTLRRALLAAPSNNNNNNNEEEEDLLPGWHADQRQPGWGGDAPLPTLELPPPAARRAAGAGGDPARLLARQLAAAAAGGADVAAGPPGAALAVGTAGAVATARGEQAALERRADQIEQEAAARQQQGQQQPRAAGGGGGALFVAPRPQIGAEPFSPDMLITIAEQLEQARSLRNLSLALAARSRVDGGGRNAAGAPFPPPLPLLLPADPDDLPPPLSQAQLARATPLLGPLGPLKPSNWARAPPSGSDGSGGKAGGPGGGGGGNGGGSSGPAAWPEGYVALCAVVKDQARDLREWVEYHRHIGVRKIYVYDNNSTAPLAASIADHLREGAVEYSYFVGRTRWRDLFRTTSQWWAYNDCVARYAHRHRWLGFIDVDEFVVFEEGSTEAPPFQRAAEEREGAGAAGAGADADADADGGGDDDERSLQRALPRTRRRRRRALTPSLVDINDFMRDYEAFGALAINWRIFGSSGFDARPSGGVLSNYVACAPRLSPENALVKVFANTAHVLTVGDDPHTVVFKKEGATTVDEMGRPVKGARTAEPSSSRVALYHYLTKSRAEYGAKMARGSAAGNFKDAAFFDAVNAIATETCTRAVPLGQRCCPSVLADLAAAERRRATERAATHAEAVAAAWPAGGIAGDGVGGVAAGRAASARAVAALPGPPGGDEAATDQGDDAEDEEEEAAREGGGGGGGAGGAGAAAGAPGRRGGGGDQWARRAAAANAEAESVDRLAARREQRAAAPRNA